jgi:hypothetical protein
MQTFHATCYYFTESTLQKNSRNQIEQNYVVATIFFLCTYGQPALDAITTFKC